MRLVWAELSCLKLLPCYHHHHPSPQPLHLAEPKLRNVCIQQQHSPSPPPRTWQPPRVALTCCWPLEVLHRSGIINTCPFVTTYSPLALKCLQGLPSCSIMSDSPSLSGWITFHAMYASRSSFTCWWTFHALSATVNNTARNMGVQAALRHACVATSHSSPVALPLTLPSIQVPILPPHQHLFFSFWQ